jgi:hypothetical protein
MNYKRLGRKHARRALKEFFARQDELAKQCTDAHGVCKDCLTNKAIEIFFDLQLKESMNPDSKFQPPPDEDSEQEYHDSATELINRTIERSAPHRRGSSITNPEHAYDTGCEIMGEIVQEVLGDLLPEDYEEDIKKTVHEKCWALMEEKAGDDIPMPKVHGLVKEFYDRGIHDTLKAAEPPPKPESLTWDFPRRVARYEKLLMGLHKSVA